MPLLHFQQSLNTTAVTEHNKLHSIKIYCIATGNTVCELQHDGLWHVQGPDVGVI